MSRPASRFLIFTTIFIDLLGFGIIIPILPAISALHLPPERAGIGAALLMGSFSLLQMLFSPFWGRLSDRYGRRPILLISLFGSTASYVMFGLADSFAFLLISRIFAGLCGANITAAQAYIADVTSEKDRTAGMGLVGMAFGLGFAFGPVIGALASIAMHHIDPAAAPQLGPGLVAGLICGLNFIGAIFRLTESLPAERRGQSSVKRFASARDALATLAHPAIGALILYFFLTTFAFANVEVSFSLFARRVMGMGVANIYMLFIFIGLVMAFTQGWLVRRAVHYVPEQILMIVGTGILAIGLALLPFFAHPIWILLPCSILALGQGLNQPSVLSLISRSAGERVQGNVLGTSQSASALARILGPAFGGVLFDIGPRWPFLAAAGLMFFAVWWATETRRRLLNHPVPWVGR